MDRKIALEEHWAVDETLHITGQPVGAGAFWDETRRLLVDFRDRRLAGMDAHGIEFAILGLNSPALQAVLDPAAAAALAHRTNDMLAEEIAHNPVPLRTSAPLLQIAMSNPGISKMEFAADSPLEGDGIEPSVPLLRKALLGVANRRRRHERRSHSQVQVRNGMLAWRGCPHPFPSRRDREFESVFLQR
jgi:hypothetical protein